MSDTKHPAMESRATDQEIVLEKNDKGWIKTVPITKCRITILSGISVLLVIQYPETPEELKKGVSKQLQFQLLPQQALAIGDRLRTVADTLIAQSADPDGAN